MRRVLVRHPADRTDQQRVAVEGVPRPGRAAEPEA